MRNILEGTPYTLQTTSAQSELRSCQAEPDFIQTNKLDRTLLSFTHTAAVIPEYICTAQAAKLCKKLSICGLLNINYIQYNIYVCTRRNFRVSPGPAKGAFGPSPKFTFKYVTRTPPNPDFL
jgi:hypothetical protein